jgi:hypothetical protein
MTRQAFTIAAIAFVCGTAAAAPLVTYESPCECRDYHGKGRLTEKNDAALPPTDPNAIQPVTPPDIFSWQGPTEPLTQSSGRIAAEQKWYAVTGALSRYEQKQTATFTLRFKTPPATSRESLWLRYRQNHTKNAVSFAKLFSAGRTRSSLFA